jgi:hypothetical protein
MAKMMFCPKCGADAQTAESYCKRCGEWLPDIDGLTRPRIFRKRTREEKIRKMRLLEAVSAGLSLTAAVIIFGVLSGRTDGHLLFLSFICCLITALYQIVNFYLGHKLHQRPNQSRFQEMQAAVQNKVGALPSGEATAFVNRSSIVENTTARLEPVQRKTKRQE